MKSRCWVGLVIAAALTAGCTNDYWPIIDPKPQTGDVKTETSVPKTVDLSVAKAWYWNTEVTVMGSAQPSALAGSKNIGGFVDVELLDKNNNVIETAMATLMPNMLSSEQPSEYKISMWAQHPREDHLKLVFVDQRDEAAYLGQGDDGGVGAGKSGESGNYSRASGTGTNGFGNFGRGISGVGGIGGIGGVQGYGAGEAR